MTTTNDIPTATKQETLTVTRTFNLSLNTVWKAWTEPETAKKWWGPETYTCPDCTIDFKVGGKYLISMQGPDGKKIWSTGTYKEIVPQKKIVYTDSFADSNGNIVDAEFYKMPGEWARELMVTMAFEEVEGKTSMTMQHVGLPPEMSADCMKGWQSSFDKLENNLK